MSTKNPLVPFDEFFKRIAKTGDPATSADALGLSPQEIKNRKKTDPEFLAQYEHAYELFKERIEEKIRKQAFGSKDPIKDDKGRTVGYGDGEKPDNRLLLALAKRHITEYKEGANVDVKVSTGVVIVKEPSKDESEWRKRFEDTEIVVDPPKKGVDEVPGA